jgi:hypothetical protein
MNRVFRSSLMAVLLFLVCASAAFAQSTQESLGDYARAVKKTKNAPAGSDQNKVYDNDNLPTTGVISVVGSEPSSPEASTSDNNTNAPASDVNKDEKKTPEIKPGQSVDDREKAFDAWKDKLKAQNEKIGALAHELDLLQREYQVKSAEFYADPANMAQHPRGFEKDNSDFKVKIADKQKDLDAAKAKLSDMQEEARRAGAPDSVTSQN